MDYVYQAPLNTELGVGVVLGSFSPLHKGHLDLIYRAKKECLGGVFVVVCGCVGDKGYPLMPLEDRYRMVREFFMDDPLVAVYCLSDDEMGIAGKTNEWDVWLRHFFTDVVKANVAGNRFKMDSFTFYVGEKEYAKEIGWRKLKTLLVDRTALPICATMIRKDPLQFWDQIAWTYHRVFSHNILVTGTASEGKTTLVEDIGRYFNIPFSFEWARQYITERCIGDWEFDCIDFLSFLNGQYHYNQSCINGRMNKGVFISDTDSIVTKMYAKYYAMDRKMALSQREFDEVIAPAADAYASKQRWDKVFVVVPKEDTVFTDDHQRYMRHGTMDARLALSEILFDELEKAGLGDKIEVLNGGYQDNFNRVKSYIAEVMVRHG